MRNQARHDRYSFPYFFDPNFDASLNPVPEELLAHHRKLQQRQRWDNADVENVAGKLTYGEYVVSKVLKVFPQLGDATASLEDGILTFRVDLRPKPSVPPAS